MSTPERVFYFKYDFIHQGSRLFDPAGKKDFSEMNAFHKIRRESSRLWYPRNVYRDGMIAIGFCATESFLRSEITTFINVCREIISIRATAQLWISVYVPPNCPPKYWRKYSCPPPKFGGAKTSKFGQIEDNHGFLS